MIGCLLFTFGCFAALLGAIIFAKAKKGEQNTLGGVIFIIGLLCIGFGGRPAFGHDHNRPELDLWYGTLKSGKGPCCGGPSVDAKTLDGPDLETKDGHYRVKLDGVWHDVEDEAVLKQPNIDGRTLVWPIGGWGGVTIRCFMPGRRGLNGKTQGNHHLRHRGVCSHRRRSQRAGRPAGQLLAAAMSGYDHDEQGRIIEFKIERVEARH